MTSDIIIIVLKRFASTKVFNKGITQKLDEKIEIPMKLDIGSREWSGGCSGRYSLYAASEHIGQYQVLSFGHYVTVAMNMETNQWYRANDDKIVKLPSVSSETFEKSYVLFYQKDN